MQKSILLLAACISSFALSAQRIEIKEGSEKFSTGSQNAISTTIYANSKDNVESKWKSLLKDFKNEKVKSDKGELFGDNILIKDMGNNPVDIYTTFEEDKKAMTVKMHVAVDLGGAYLNSSEQREKYKVMEKIIKDFAIEMTKEPLKDKVQDAEKALSKLQDQQKDLEKDNKDLHKDIEDYKSNIEKDKKDIVEVEAQIVTKKEEIKIQQKVVDASAGAVSEQAKSAQKIHEKLKDQLSDMEKKKKNEEEDIESNNKKIKKAEDDIKKNESDQEKKKDEIEKQKKVVEEAKNAVNKVD